MRNLWRTKWKWILIGAFLFFPLLALLVQPVFFPWSELNCRHQDVDINSGKLKFSRYIFFIMISEKVEDSELSKVLRKSGHEFALPEWYKVNTLSPGLHNSPHYFFHGAINQIRMLSLWWELEDVPEAIQAKTAADVLALWKFSGGDSLAKYYIDGLPLGETEDFKQQVFESVARLEIPQVSTNENRVMLTIGLPSGRPIETVQGYYAPDGTFVADGALKMWNLQGTLHTLDHYKNGKLDGKRFSWERDGKLIEISEFRLGEFVKYSSEQLANHPDFQEAMLIYKDNKIEDPHLDHN